MKTKFSLLIFPIALFLYSSCQVEAPVTTYDLQVNNELVNDTIDHALAYTFEVVNNQTAATETGVWHLELLKKDGTFFLLQQEENKPALHIGAGTLIDRIPVNEQFEYDGMRIKGRIVFSNLNTRLEKEFTVWGKPTKPVFEILSAEENGYPNEMNITFGFVCDGATRIKIRHKNDDYGYIDSYILTTDIYSETFNALDMTTENEFHVYASNFLGTTVSEPIYIGGIHSGVAASVTDKE